MTFKAVAFALIKIKTKNKMRTKPPCPPLKPAHDKVAKGVMLESAFGIMLVHCLLTKNEVQKFLHGCEAVTVMAAHPFIVVTTPS